MKSENLALLKMLFLEKLKIDNYDRFTIGHYDRHLNYFLEYLKQFYNADKSSQITKPNLRGFVHYIKKHKNQHNGKPLIEKTIFRICLHVKFFCDFLTQNEYLAISYGPIFEMRVKEQENITNVLTESKLKKVLDMPNELTYYGFRDKVIFELMYNTGLRREEVCNLELYDLNLEEKTIFVRQGKGKKDRYVPMGVYLEKYLKEYIEKVRPVLVEGYEENRLFIDKRKHAMTPNTLGGLVRKYSRQAHEEFSCHTFRHSFGTHMLKHGANILHISKILGHENIDSTQIYTRVYPRDLKKIILERHPRNTHELATEEIVIPKRQCHHPKHDVKKRMERAKKLTEKHQGVQLKKRGKRHGRNARKAN